MPATEAIPSTEELLKLRARIDQHAVFPPGDHPDVAEFWQALRTLHQAIGLAPSNSLSLIKDHKNIIYVRLDYSRHQQPIHFRG